MEKKKKKRGKAAEEMGEKEKKVGNEMKETITTKLKQKQGRQQERGRERIESKCDEQTNDL